MEIKSHIIKELKGLKQTVYKQLVTNSLNRNSDERLEANIWWQEAQKKGIDLREISAFKMLEMQIKGKFSSSASIRRARRLINSQFEETRGESYKGRQEESNKVAEEIHKI